MEVGVVYLVKRRGCSESVSHLTGSWEFLGGYIFMRLGMAGTRVRVVFLIGKAGSEGLGGMFCLNGVVRLCIMFSFFLLFTNICDDPLRSEN